MRYNNQSFTTKLAIVVLLVLAISLFHSCKKETDLSQRKEVKFENDFFRYSDNLNVKTIDLISKLKNENTKTKFVNEIPAKWGSPIWEKIIWDKNNLNYATADSSYQDSSGNIIIPFTINNNDVNAILIAKELQNGFSFVFYTTEYLSNISNDTTLNPSDVEAKLLMFFYSQNMIYGTKDFYNIPSHLFQHYEALDFNNKKMISILPTNKFELSTCSIVTCNICSGTDANCPFGGWWIECTTIFLPPENNPGGVYIPSGGGGTYTPPSPPQNCNEIPYYKTPPYSTNQCTPVPPTIPTTTPAPYSHINSFDITQINNLCISGILNLIGPNAANAHIIKIYQKTLTNPQNTSYNIKFVEDNTLVNSNGTPKAGTTTYTINNNNVAEIQIAINATYLATSSKEFITSMIMHELAHAVLLVALPNLSGSAHHHRIFRNNVFDIASSTVDLFPNLTAKQGIAIALQGMDDVIFDGNTPPQVYYQYNNYATRAYGMDIATSKTIAIPFFTGSAGTPCQ
jgi:hypothetical protein